MVLKLAFLRHADYGILSDSGIGCTHGHIVSILWVGVGDIPWQSSGCADLIWNWNFSIILTPIHPSKGWPSVKSEHHLKLKFLARFLDKIFVEFNESRQIEMGVFVDG